MFREEIEQEYIVAMDGTEYLKKIFTLDRITLNEDRHLNNLAVLSQGNQFVPAPIFDNGVSLLTANRSVNWHFPMEDIEVLRDFGIDIENKREKPAGYYVASRDFELPELKLLVDAVQCTRFITKKKSEELIKKLENLASKSEAAQLQRQVFVVNRNKTKNENIYYNVDKIHTAISEIEGRI